MRRARLSVTTGTVNHAEILAPLVPPRLDAIKSDSVHELREAMRQRRRDALARGTCRSRTLVSSGL